MESPFCAGDESRDEADFCVPDVRLTDVRLTDVRLTDVRLPDFRLIETFGSHPGEGVRHAALHLARLARSAAYFGIPCDVAAVRARLDALRPSATDGVLRCRLTLDVRGRVEVSTAPLGALPEGWRVSIANERLTSQDPWLRHKTTRRALYDRTRAHLPEGGDEVVFLNERDEVCEGTITSVFVTLEHGARVTPPLGSGVLPGVLRQSLLNSGAVREQVVTLADLRRAHTIQVGNSLRGLIKADFDGMPTPSRGGIC